MLLASSKIRTAASQISTCSHLAAAVRIFDEANNNGFVDEQEVYDLLVATYDKNQNDMMCIDRKPDRNPHSTVVWYYVREDNSNGANS